MRFDLQSDKNTPHKDIDQGAAGCTPTDDFRDTDGSTFSIIVRIILVKLMCLKQITDGSI